MKKSNVLLYVLVGVLGILVLVFFAVMFFECFACLVSELFGITGTKSKKETLQFLGWIISGFITFFGLFVFNRRAAALDKANELTEKGHVQDRFKAAVDHLSNEESESGRIASFYEFYYLVKDAKGNKDGYAQTSPQTILDILCAHLRQIASTEENITDYNDPDSQEINDEEYIPNEQKPKRPKEEVTSLIGLLFGEETGTAFSGLKFNFQHVKVNLTDVDFSSANLTKANFSFADLTEPDFQNTILCHANFGEAHLRTANFQNADLQEADLHKAFLFQADFQGANLQGADLREARLQGANLRGSELQAAYLQGATLTFTNLQNANLQGADLRDTYLRRAGFQNANLQGADLQEADLWGTYFQKADLRRVDFQKAKNLKTAKLSGAKYGDDTQFPEGFNPKDYDMEYCPPDNDE